MAVYKLCPHSTANIESQWPRFNKYVIHKYICLSKGYYKINVANACNLCAYFTIFLKHDIIFIYNIQKLGIKKCSIDNCI